MRTHRERIRTGQVNLKLWRDFSQSLTLEELDLAAHIFIGAVSGELSLEEMESHIRLVEGVLAERRQK